MQSYRHYKCLPTDVWRANDSFIETLYRAAAARRDSGIMLVETARYRLASRAARYEVKVIPGFRKWKSWPICH